MTFIPTFQRLPYSKDIAIGQNWEWLILVSSNFLSSQGSLLTTAVALHRQAILLKSTAATTPPSQFDVFHVIKTECSNPGSRKDQNSLRTEFFTEKRDCF